MYVIVSWISGLILREPQAQQDLATKMAGYSDLGVPHFRKITASTFVKLKSLELFFSNICCNFNEIHVCILIMNVLISIGRRTTRSSSIRSSSSRHLSISIFQSKYFNFNISIWSSSLSHQHATCLPPAGFPSPRPRQDQAETSTRILIFNCPI